MSALKEFCDMARSMIVEEQTGKGEYRKVNEKLYEVIEESKDTPAELELRAISRKITDIQSQEGEHATIWAIVIDHHSKGI